MRKLFSDKKYRNFIIFNIAGVIFVFLGWFLNELYLAKMITIGGSNLMLVGIILWGMGEVGLIRI